jgi:uncharacterized protein YkwD
MAKHYEVNRGISPQPGLRLCMESLPLIAALLLATAFPTRIAAQGPRSIAEQYLFAAANADRARQGIPALHWDDALYRAAAFHAVQMADHQSISHQYAGEPDVSARAMRAGARFSVIAENVAEAPTAVIIHNAWMNSPHHRDNLLDPRVTSVGIRVLSRQGQLYAVEDFDRNVPVLSLEAQEHAVASLLQSSSPMTAVSSTPEARRTCAMDTGYAGANRPWFVMRYTSGSLDQIPSQLQDKLATGRFHTAVVGACRATNSQNFTAYNIAVLLYP